MRQLHGDDRCVKCRDYAFNNPPPPGMEQWPCLAIGDGSRCTFCIILHATCSFNKPGLFEPIAAATGEEQDASADSAPGRSPSKTPSVVLVNSAGDKINEPGVDAEVVTLKCEPDVTNHGPSAASITAADASRSNGEESGLSVGGRGRLTRQKKSFVSQLKNLISVASEWCKEVEGTNEDVPELLADTLKEMRRQMRSLEEIASDEVARGSRVR